MTSTKHALLIVLFVTSCAVAPWENIEAPAEVSSETLCERLAGAGCPQGVEETCVENLDMNSAAFPGCEGARNDLRRCYYVDLPADAEAELATDPFTCVLSDACANETDALCHCERGPACDVDE